MLLNQKLNLDLKIISQKPLLAYFVFDYFLYFVLMYPAIPPFLTTLLWKFILY